MASSSRFVLVVAGLVVALSGGSNSGSATSTRHVTWSSAVGRICANALLFEGRHESGTRAGAIAVGSDIRASTARRIRRIETLPMSAPKPLLAARWLRLERGLAAVYASSYVRIYEAIAAAKTRRQRADLPRVLGRLLHAPDALRSTTMQIARRLGVPDCTGGGTPDRAAPGP